MSNLCAASRYLVMTHYWRYSYTMPQIKHKKFCFTMLHFTNFPTYSANAMPLIH